MMNRLFIRYFYEKMPNRQFFILFYWKMLDQQFSFFYMNICQFSTFFFTFFLWKNAELAIFHIILLTKFWIGKFSFFYMKKKLNWNFFNWRFFIKIAKKMLNWRFFIFYWKTLNQKIFHSFVWKKSQIDFFFHFFCQFSIFS